MDPRFFGAMQAAWRGALDDFEGALDADPALVTARSSCSHPTLLQFVVLDGGTGKIPHAERFATALIDRGAPLDEPLVAAASIGHIPMVDLLLEVGAPIDACSPWTPLEEAVYWAHGPLLRHLLARGATVSSLRAAAGVNDVDATGRLLAADPLPDAAGPVRYPWGEKSADSVAVLNQALVIAAKNDAAGTIPLLLDRGADPNAFPPGVHEGGSALHLAAMHGCARAVELLVAAGGDARAKDPKHGSDPAGWARHGGFAELAERLGG